MGTCISRTLSANPIAEPSGVAPIDLSEPARRDPLPPGARPRSMPHTPLPVYTQGLADHARQYLRGRDTLHKDEPARFRSISPTTQSMLNRANAAIRSTRDQLPMRGNVLPDVLDTRGQSNARVGLARHMGPLRDVTRPEGPMPSSTSALITALGAAGLMGSGNCGEFSKLVMLNMGKCLHPGEEVAQTASTKIDHAWAELKGPARLDGSQRCVVLDPWAQGSAIEAEHSRYAANAADKRVVLLLNSSGTAHNISSAVQSAVLRAASDPELLGDISEALESNYQRREQFLAAVPSLPFMWPEDPVESDAFIAEVGAAEERLRQAGAAAGNATAEP